VSTLLRAVYLLREPVPVRHVMLTAAADTASVCVCVCVCAGTQECPSGVVNEETFKYIYAQFFPQGGQSVSASVSPRLSTRLMR